MFRNDNRKPGGKMRGSFFRTRIVYSPDQEAGCSSWLTDWVPAFRVLVEGTAPFIGLQRP